jgi:hypothetical protein
MGNTEVLKEAFDFLDIPSATHDEPDNKFQHATHIQQH